MKNKILTLLLAIITSVGTIFADSGACGENVTWDLTDSVLTISGTGAMDNYYSRWDGSFLPPWYSQKENIAAVIIYDNVTSIGDLAFYQCSNLTSVTIPNSVTSIGEYAFYQCYGLTSVTIPNSVTNIGSGAFSGCRGLTSVTIPNSVTSIGEDAFSGCRGLTSVTIPNSVTNIGSGAFFECSGLTSIEIPNSVTSIGMVAFAGCTGLTSITVGDGVLRVEEGAFMGCIGLEKVNITDIAAWCNIEFINRTGYSNPLIYARHLYFNETEIINLIIPDNVTSIGECAFYGCTSLNSIDIPNSVTSIGYSAFWGCTGLTSVTIGNNVISIGSEAFSGCSNLRRVICRAVNPPNIDYNPFYYTNPDLHIYVPYQHSILDSYKIAWSNIADRIFCYTAVLSLLDSSEIVLIEDTIKVGSIEDENKSLIKNADISKYAISIENNVFDGCNNLHTVTLNSNSIVSKNYSAAQNLKTIFGEQVKTYIIGDSVTSIGGYAFNGCRGLNLVTIPNSVVSIENSAFKGCTGLTAVIIPNSVTSIGDDAFNDCTGLTSITIPNNVTSIGDYVFYGCSGITSVTWNAKNCNSWNFGSQVESFTFGDSVEVIPAGLCQGMNKLTSIIIPNSVTSIGDDAFNDCTGLTSITIPNNVTSIGNSAFNGCNGLTSMTIPNSVTSIGNSAFNGCNGLTSMTIPNSVTSIGKYAFYGCSSITSVTWNAKNCNSWNFGSQVESFTFGDSVEVIPAGLCQGMNKLTSITIPNSVTSIGEWALDGCTGLTSVTIPNSVTTIENNAFYMVFNIEYNGNATGSPWGAKAINGYVDGYLVYSNDSKTSLLACYSAAKRIIIPYSVRDILEEAFYGCNDLTSVTINSESIMSREYTSRNNISHIFGTQVTEYIIGNAVTSIGKYAFYSCGSLTSVTIGNSVANIGSGAFYGCSGITSVTWNAKNCKGWNFGSQVESFSIGDSVEVVPANLCEGMNKLTSLPIGKNVKRIGNAAFKGCENVSTLTLPASLKIIGDEAFYGWKKITKLHIPNDVDTIGASAFENCIYVTSIYLGNKMTEIGDYAFKGCIRVNDITCMNTVTPVVYDNTLTSISQYAYLYVQAGSKRTYQLDPYWSRFDIKELGTEDASLNRDGVVVVANDDNAIFTWPTDSAADTYSLQITKDGEVFCTLVFNSNGQLIGIAFAPSRDGAPHAPAATTSIAGMSFTVTGLNSATRYGYNLTTKNDQQQVIKDYSGRFATQGYIPEKYTITFVNWDGSELQTLTNVEEFTTPEYTGVTPTKPADAEYTYTFAGWTPEIVAATQDATYTATFNATKNKYLVIFQDDDQTELKRDSVAYGEMPVAPIDPTKPADGEYTYTFAGWTPEIVAVTKDATYTATYDAMPISEGLDNISSEDTALRKVMIDGTVYILRGDKIYTTTGQEVR